VVGAGRAAAHGLHGDAERVDAGSERRGVDAEEQRAGGVAVEDAGWDLLLTANDPELEAFPRGRSRDEHGRRLVLTEEYASLVD